MKIVIISILLLTSTIFPVRQANTINGVGLMMFNVTDPVTSQVMIAAAFYPSSNRNKTTRIAAYEIDASKEINILPGQYPCIILSHGNGGSLWGHHSLASSLTRAGYIVLTLMHPTDNFADTAGIGALSTIYGRPLQISALLTTALSAPFLASHIDQQNIAFIGYSAGGQTGLILAGGQPDFHLLETYCLIHNKEVICEAKGKIRHDRPDLLPLSDPRVKAFILFAPLAATFPQKSLQKIQAPFLIYVGEKDNILSPQDNAINLAQHLQNSQLIVLPDAGHFVFLSPCSQQLKQTNNQLCLDPPGINRQRIQQNISQEIKAFLQNIEQVHLENSP